jgi:2-polyprenyl-3-methyl-5-hydroxy-6-metoxy-1,4-benzoquinol methylase
MSYANQTINNSSLIKRFTHLKRFEVTKKILYNYEYKTLLDFGAGDGFLIKYLANYFPDKMFYGFDPLNFMYEELTSTFKKSKLNNVTITDNLKSLANKKFDIVCCMEVLEHFSKSNQIHRLTEIKSLVKNDGIILVSVPLETGLSSLFKNIIRRMLSQQQEDSSLKNIMKSFFSSKIERNKDGYIYTHIGFNHKHLESVFYSEGLKIIKKKFSPVPLLYGILNSQVFYILKVKS